RESNVGQRHRDRDAQHVCPAPAGNGRRRADGDEAAVADRASPSGGDGIWRRVFDADAVLCRPQCAGAGPEEAGLGVHGTAALAALLFFASFGPARGILQITLDAFISCASSLEPVRDLHGFIIFADRALASDAHAAGGLLGATVADLFMPVFSGHLVDAMTSGASDPAARRAAFVAFGAIVALGLASMILRLIGLQAIVPFTLRIMSDVSRDAFMRV